MDAVFSKRRSSRTSARIIKTLIYILCILTAILCLLPFWLLIVNATRETHQIQQSVSLIPGTYLLHNLKNLFADGSFPLARSFFNSAFISFCSTALCIYFSALTAFAFAAYDFRLKSFLYTVILVIIMIPGQLGAIGFFKLMNDFGLYDTFVPLIIPAIASASTVFFLKQYMNANFSIDLVQAARIDGSSEFRTFNSIVLPLLMPALATMAIFGIISSWNNYMGPLMLLSSEEKFTLPMIVQNLKDNNTDWGKMYLGILMTILPLVVVYMVFSKYIIAGVAMGGVKE